MKKYIFQSLAILAGNIVVSFFLGLALFAAFKDIILAAAIASIALPGILLQPWFIPFLFVPGGLFLAPFLTTTVTVLLYRKSKFNWIKLLLSRLKSRKAIAVITGIYLCVFATGLARYIDFPALRREVPKRLEYSLKDINLALGDARYYCLNSFIDSEWLCQANISEQDLDVLENKLNMHPIPADQVGDAFWKMPPYWWKPLMSDQARVISTNNFPMEDRGTDGWHGLAIWNPEKKVLHMWIKDNF